MTRPFPNPLGLCVSAISGSPCLPPLKCAIGLVVLMRPKKQVIGVHTRRIVAGVTNKAVKWIDVVMEAIRHTVSRDVNPPIPPRWITIRSSHGEFSITPIRPIGRPFPTLTMWSLSRRLVDLQPKAGNILFSQPFENRIMVSHESSPYRWFGMSRIWCQLPVCGSAIIGDHGSRNTSKTNQ